MNTERNVSPSGGHRHVATPHMIEYGATIWVRTSLTLIVAAQSSLPRALIGQCGWECVHKGRHGHNGREEAAQALAGSVEARDCGGDIRTWGIGFDDGASVRREREPGLQLASSVSHQLA
jgi:hypothetical protein